MMNFILTLSSWHAALGRLLDALQAPFLLGARVFVAWQFWKSGWLKLSAWDQTIELFRTEYSVPLVAPELAAWAGTFGELLFPALLILGLFSRVGALGLSAVNVLAVVSYSHVLLAEGFEAALGQHVLWGFMLLVIVFCGPGRWAADGWLAQKLAARCRPQGLPLVA